MHAVQNTIDSCINSATDRRRYVLEHRFTKFSETTAITFKVNQDHRFWYQTKAYMRLPILVINTNLAPILHRFRDTAFDRSKIAIFGYPSCV